jgi:hypothetical protein
VNSASDPNDGVREQSRDTQDNAAATAAHVRDKARALALRGDFQGAIAYASSENRRVRDSQLERWLVQWRHRAFDSSRVSPRPDWPPQALDLFAGCEGAPEIEAEHLTAATIAAGILHHGCLIVRGLVSSEEARDLAAKVDCVFDAAKAAVEGAPLEQTLPWYAPLRVRQKNEDLHHARTVGYRGAGILTADSPRLLFDLLELYERRRVIATLAEYLGERPTLSAQKAALRRVPPTTGTDWHQDGAFLGDDIRAVNVWLALSECGVDAPGLDLIPRRLTAIVETGTGAAKFRWSVDPAAVEAVAPGTPVASPVFMPGDAVVFDQLFLHRTGVRPGMTRQRWAIESWFFAPSGAPREYFPVVV